jgi:hypothetical protein
MSITRTYYKPYPDPSTAVLAAANQGSISSVLMNDRIKYNGTLNVGNVVTPFYNNNQNVSIKGGAAYITKQTVPRNIKQLDILEYSPITGKKYETLEPSKKYLVDYYDRGVINSQIGTVDMQARASNNWPSKKYMKK